MKELTGKTAVITGAGSGLGRAMALAFAPAGAVQALLDLYPSSRSELKKVRPGDVGAERIGHFGFFRERFRDTLWRDAADWLEKQ